MHTTCDTSTLNQTHYDGMSKSKTNTKLPEYLSESIGHKLITYPHYSNHHRFRQKHKSLK